MFIAMLLYLLLVLIRPQDYPALVDSVGLPLQPIMLITAAGFWLLSPRKHFDAPQYPLLMMFFGVMLVSHVFNGWIGGAIEQIGKFAPVVLAFVVFANGLDRRGRVLKIMATFALCAAVLAVHGIEQRQTGLGWTGVEMSQGTRIQYVGIFNDPNDLGLLFVSCIPMAAYLSSRGGLLGLRRLFWLAITGVLIYGVYLTDSRGALLALLAVMGVYIWQRKGVIVAGTLGAMAVAVLLALPSRFSEIDAEEESAQGRIESWYEGLQMFQGHPVFGVGPDQYTDYNPLTAHNSFVLILAETGIIGYTLWLAFVVYCFRMMWTGSRPQAMQAWEEQGDENPGAGDPEMDLLESGLVETDLVEMDSFEMDVEALDARIEEGRAIAMTLLLSLIGFFIAAFFLSRSYVIILYLLTALVVAHYADIRRDDPGLPRFALADDILLWPAVGLGSAIFLYIVVKVLLVMQ
ncbi:MAG: O-antigen ligase family protein [Lysobacter sp.]|nr:O-antigen ligase family protein [Lysobacter sp.]